jgi:peptidyl-prolyl cis-trans isomerase C
MPKRNWPIFLLPLSFSRSDLWYDGEKFISFFARKRANRMPSIFLTALLVVAAQTQTPPATSATTSTTAAKTAVASPPGKAQSPTAAARNTNPIAIAPSEAVITIHGLCPTAKSSENSAAACNTVVTRKQFDALVDALSALGPPLLLPQRRGVAEAYATTLRNYEAAKKAGIEKDPRYAEVMRIAQMRAMGDMYNALLQEKAKKVSPQEIQDYYNANLPKFEELTLRRVTLPRYNTANLKDEEFAAKARKLAGEMHDRAAKDEDMDTIQKETFSALGVKDPPSTHMAVVRRGIYAPDQEKQIFALKANEVTAVFEQPSAFIVFKLESRGTPSLEKSKDEIVRTLVQQHMEKLEQSRDKSVQIDYNDQYLGPPQISAWIPPGQSNATTGHNQPANNTSTAAKPASAK